MQTHQKQILVTGATGTQGRAVVRHLLERGYAVRAFTRDPDKPAARALAAASVAVVKGDFDDRASIAEAMRGAYGCFSVQNYWEGFPGQFLGAAGEIRQGKNVADAAREASIQHLVYSSSGGAGQGTGVAHVDSKFEIELYLRALGLPVTVIRPVFFMDNFDTPAFGYQRPALEGRIEIPLAAERKLQMIAADDIGHFTALAFDKPEEYLGAVFELAGDELTTTEIAEAFTRVMGRPVRSVGDPAHIAEIRKFSEEFAAMYTWFNGRGFEAFIPALRALHPPLTRFEQYLRNAGWGSGEKA